MDRRIARHPLGYWEVINRPSSEELRKYYADKYYQEAKGSYEQQYTESELKFFRAKLEQRAFIVERYFPKNETASHQWTLLDVGCGEGYALDFFQKHGWHVKGLDFSSAGVCSKNPDCLGALVTGDIFDLLTEEIRSGRRFDVVWLQNVLEHVLDPLHLLSSLRELVNPNGLAVVTVPNDCSITQQALLSNNCIDHAFWVAPPEHLTYFDHISLTTAATATGWETLETMADFPVDWFLFNPKSNFVADRSLGKPAHTARVHIENMIHNQPIADVVSYYSSLAKIGLGRNITAFLRPRR